MKRWLARLALGAVTGCAAVSGLSEYEIVDPSSATDGGLDATSTTRPPDAAVEAGADGAAPCPPLLGDARDGGSRTAIIARAGVPSGTEHVFRGCPSLVLDPSTAALVQGTPSASAIVFLEWEPTTLWVRADVTDPTSDRHPDGGAPVFMSDSFEVYVSTDPNRAVAFGAREHQVIVNRFGQAAYRTNGTAVLPYDLATVSTTAAGYRVVVRIVLGEELRSGQTLFVDALLSDGIEQKSYLLWAQEPHGPPDSSTPAHDTRLFSPVTLE
ncbi:MAG: sugar-binding protein [Labilithrix sp.]